MRPGYANFRFSPGEQRRRELIADAARIARIGKAEGNGATPRTAELLSMVGLVRTRIAARIRLVTDRPRRLETGVGKQG